MREEIEERLMDHVLSLFCDQAPKLSAEPLRNFVWNETL
jgi:hypothetical protein